MKKIIIILFIPIFIGFIPLSCSNCDDNYLGKYKFNIDSIQTFQLDSYNYDTTEIYISNSSTDTIVKSRYYRFEITLNISDIKIAMTTPNFTLFTNSCYALTKRQCFDVKDYIIENSVDSILITSDNEFNGIPIGRDISGYFKFNQTVTNYRGYYNQDTTLQQIKSSFNSSFKFAAYQCYDTTFCGRYAKQFNVSVYLNKKPYGSNNHQFTLKIYLHNGILLSKSTKRIVWL